MITQRNVVSVIPSGASLGAEIMCGNAREIDDDAISVIKEALLEHQVIYLRAQEFDDEAFLRWGRQFGTFQISNPLPSPALDNRKDGIRQGGHCEIHPELTVVSNIIENGVALGGLGDGEVVWHTDMSSFGTPPSFTMLYALEVPEKGGGTGFANMYAAYETLTDDRRRLARSLELKHDATIDAAGYLRKAHAQSANVPVTESPGRWHPLVRTHPESGRDCLYLGRRKRAYLSGLAIDESEALLDEFWSHATQTGFTWTHQWKPGDLLIWDNRCVMHRREPFASEARRLLHRLVITGSKPEIAGVTA